MAHAHDLSWIGQTLEGRFRIDEGISEGGPGILFRGFDIRSEHDVAIRIFAPTPHSDEARMLQALSVLQQKSMTHASLAQLLASGAQQKHVYTVSEWPRGVRLARRMQIHGRLDLAEFAPLAVELLKPLGHAHSRGLSHGDLCPATISLGPVKVLDYGLLPAAADAGFHTTMAGRIPAPEQLEGTPADTQTDVFALGALFYYLLSTQYPWPAGGGPTSKTQRHLAEVLPNQHGISQRLIALVQRCLDANPDGRPFDANDLFDELLDAVDPGLLRPVDENSGTQVGLGFRAAGPRPITIDPNALPLLSRTVAKADEPEPEPEPAPEPPPGSELLRLSTDELGRPPLPTKVTVAEPMPAASRGRAVIFGLLASVFAVGVTTVVVSGTDSAEVQEDTSMREALTQASTLADEGKWEKARDHLRQVEFSLAQFPHLRGETERLRKRIEVGQLLDTARKLEARDKPEAAITAYRDLLARDPTHVEARERLVELTAPKPKVVAPVEDAAVAAVALVSDPKAANLFIDNRAVGTTPYQSKLALGKHVVRLEADGYETWEQEIEVAENNPPIVATLKKLRRRGRGRTHVSADRPADNPTPEPAPEPEPEPASDPKNGALKPTVGDNDTKRPGPFLPTK